MSGPFKSMLGPSLKRLIEHIKESQKILKKDAISETEHDSVISHGNKIEKILNTVESKNKLWLEFITDLEKAERTEHEKIYNDYVVDGKQFYEWLELGREIIDTIDSDIKTDDDEQHRQPNVQTTVNHQVNEQRELNVRLPRLDLPEFNGDPHQWFSFWQSFESSIDRSKFSKIDKMKFLLNCVKGEAKDAISDLMLSNENYSNAVKILEERFGDKNILIEALEAELFSLPKCDDHPVSLKKTVDKIEKIMRQLDSIGEDIENSVLTSLIKSKLPRNILMEITKEEKESNVKWGTSTLRNALTKLVSIRESVFQCTKHFRGETSNKQYNNQVKPNWNKNEPNKFDKFNKVRSFQTTAKNKPNITCYFCDGNHWTNECKTVWRREDRLKRLNDKRRCYRCLREGHTTRNCDSRRNCQNCNGPHHNAICPKKIYERTNEQTSKNMVQYENRSSQNNQQSQRPIQTNNRNNNYKAKTHVTQAEEAENDQEENTVQVNNSMAVQTYSTLLKGLSPVLMVLKIEVFSPRNKGETIKVLAFLDSGSEVSYITDKLVKKLKLPKLSEGILEVCAFQGSNLGKMKTGKYVIGIKRMDGRDELLDVLSINKISDELNYVHLKKICSDSNLDEIKKNVVIEKGEPDILLGINEFLKYFVRKREISKDCYLVDTVIGSLICGENHRSLLENKVPVHTHMAINPSNIDEMPNESEIKSWWDLQSIGIRDDPEEKDDEIAQQLFDKSIKQVNGRYRTKWLWKDENPDLQSNYGIAYRCLESLVTRFQNANGIETLKRIDETINDQLKNNIIEEAERKKEQLEHYLPHHPVFKGEKIREVYNASAKTRSGKSLNQHMYRGPLKLPDLAGLLLRFRLPKFPLLGDIEKAFLQIELEEEDKEVTKFLWVRNINEPLTPNNLVIYRFQRIAFGIICSPSILAMTIEHHLKKYEERIGLNKLINNIYVDNIFVGCDTEDEVYEKYKELKEIFAEGKMNLREFVTNANKALEKIPDCDKLKDKNPKILGIKWDINQDEIEIKFPVVENITKYTRRKVLEIMASLFDPLGLVSPCLVKAKLLFQKLWENPKTWDEKITDEQEKEWNEVVQEWSGKTVKIQRRVIKNESKNCQLHVFVDATQSTYAACVYLRAKMNKEVKIFLVYARNRIKSKKQKLTIPRMELLALLIGVRALKFVENELQLNIVQKYVWCDASAVLSWLTCKEQQPKFVENRLIEIRKHNDCIFKHVSTDCNPADTGSRGCSPTDIQFDKNWWNGPDWLASEPDCWELSPDIIVKPNDVIHTFMSRTNFTEKLIENKKFTSWNKLIKIMSCALQFVRKILPESITKHYEWNKAYWAMNFKTLDLLMEGDYDYAAEVALIKSSQLEIDNMSNYEIFEDDLGMIRLKSRIERTDVDNPYLIKPIYLPKNCTILPLIIQDIHERMKHVGVQSTLTEFLSKFWTPQSRRTVKMVISRCRMCRIMKSYPFKLPKMPNLPEYRVQRTTPFSSIGIDHLGPTVYNENNERHKCWITLITCLTTRAVYLEPVKNLKAESCLEVLKRFSARRGCPEKVLSDNSKTFIACSNLFKNVRIIGKNLNWKFIKALSPWQGGVYERIVALVKDAFKKTLGKNCLEWEKMITFTVEVEGMINMRPLTYVDENPDIPGIVPLRPIDFICPKMNLCAILDIEPYMFKLEKHELKESFRKTEKILDETWRRWYKEYLTWIRDKSQWTIRGPRSQTKREPKVNEVVIVEEDMIPRNMWKLAKIVELQDTTDGRKVRNVKILMPNGNIISRPINKLYPLEVDLENHETEKQIIEAIEEKDIPDEINEEESQWISEDELTCKNETNESEKNIESTSKAENNDQFRSKQTRYNLRSAKNLFIGILYIIMFIFVSSTKSVCPSCKVDCNQNGITIYSSEEIEKYEICCSEGSCVTHLRVEEFQFQLPKDVLITHHHCEVSFWTRNSNLLTSDIKCEPIDACSLISCYFCVERIMNHQCSPFWSLLMIAIGIIITIIGICILSWIIPFICTILRCCPSKRKSIRTIRILNRKGLFATIICINIALAEVISRGAKTEECFRKNDKIECGWSFTETLNLLPDGSTVTLLFKDDRNKILGKLEFILKSFKMKCSPIMDKWLRSYKVQVITAKSCPGDNSCIDDKCQQVKLHPNTNLTELVKYEKYLGYNGCIESCSFLWCDCGMKVGASCLFYRVYVEPASPEIYDLFTCKWIPLFDVDIDMELTGNETNHKLKGSFTLHPGLTIHGTNLSITPTQYSLPPEPELMGKFVGNGKIVALIDEIHTNVHCHNRLDAYSLNCEIDTTICDSCWPDDSTAMVSCLCNDLKLEELVITPEKMLPIKSEELNLEYDGSYVYSIFNDVPVEIVLKIENFKLVTINDYNKCTMVINEFVGCYNCRTGADLNYTCTTDEGIGIAEIKCSDGTAFTVKCSKSGENELKRLTFDYSHVDISCKVECLGGFTDMNIKGSLFLIPEEEYIEKSKWKGEKINAENMVETDKQPGGYMFANWKMPNLDLLDLFGFVTKIQNLLTLIGLITVILIILCIIVRFNLFFRLYKLLGTKLVFVTICFFCTPGESLIDISYNRHLDSSQPCKYIYSMYEYTVFCNNRHFDKSPNFVKYSYYVEGRGQRGKPPYKKHGKTPFIPHSRKNSVKICETNSVEKIVKIGRNKMKRVNHLKNPGIKEENEILYYYVVVSCLLDKLIEDVPCTLEKLFTLEKKKCLVDSFNMLLTETDVNLTYPSSREVNYLKICEKSAKVHISILPNTSFASHQESIGNPLTRPNLPPICEVYGELCAMEHICIRLPVRDYYSLIYKYKLKYESGIVMNSTGVKVKRDKERIDEAIQAKVDAGNEERKKKKEFSAYRSHMYENTVNTNSPSTSQQIAVQPNQNVTSKGSKFVIPKNVPNPNNKPSSQKTTNHLASKPVSTQTDLKMSDFISLKGPKMIYLSIILFCLLFTNALACSPSKLVENKQLNNSNHLCYNLLKYSLPTFPSLTFLRKEESINWNKNRCFSLLEPHSLRLLSFHFLHFRSLINSRRFQFPCQIFNEMVKIVKIQMTKVTDKNSKKRTHNSSKGHGGKRFRTDEQQQQEQQQLEQQEIEQQQQRLIEQQQQELLEKQLREQLLEQQKIQQQQQKQQKREHRGKDIHMEQNDEEIDQDELDSNDGEKKNWNNGILDSEDEIDSDTDTLLVQEFLEIPVKESHNKIIRGCSRCKNCGQPEDIYKNHIKSNKLCPSLYLDSLGDDHPVPIAEQNQEVELVSSLSKDYSDRSTRSIRSNEGSTRSNASHEKSRVNYGKNYSNEEKNIGENSRFINPGTRMVNNTLDQRERDDQKEGLKVPFVGKRMINNQLLFGGKGQTIHQNADPNFVQKQMNERRQKLVQQAMQNVRMENGRGPHCREAGTLGTIKKLTNECFEFIPRNGNGCKSVIDRSAYWSRLEMMKNAIDELIQHAADWDAKNQLAGSSTQ